MRQRRLFAFFCWCYVAAVLAGLALLLVPWPLLRPHAQAYALSQSADGVVTAEGLREMWITVRLAGVSSLLVGLTGLILLRAARWFGPTQADGAERTSPPPLTRLETILLLALVVVALGLRLPRIGDSFNCDEAFTALFFVHPARPLQALLLFKGLNNHPLFSLSAALSARLFGESEAVLRLPALAAGVGAVAGAFLLARRSGGVAAGAAAALLLALSPPAVNYSALARGYSPLILLSLLSTLALVRALEAPSRARWIAYVALSVFGLWTHLFMAVTIAGHTLGVLIASAWRKLRGESVKGGSEFVAAVSGVVLLAVLAYAPVLHRVFFEITGFALVERAKPMTWPAAAEGAGGNFTGIMAGDWLGGGWPQSTFALLITIAAALGAKRAFRDLGAQRVLLVLVPLLTAAPVLILLKTGHHGAYRFFVETIPLGLVLAGVGVVALARRSSLPGWLLLISLVGLEVRGLADYYACPQSALRALSQGIEREMRPGDRLGTDWSVGTVLPYYLKGIVLADVATTAGGRGRRLYACRMECVDAAPSFEGLTARLLFEAPDAGWPYRVYELEGLPARSSP